MLRRALLVGYANRLARRMPRHNGYRTLGTLGGGASLAQLHPSTARIAPDDDGLTPEFVIFHELIATARVFLAKVRLFLCGLASVRNVPTSVLFFTWSKGRA